MKRIRFRAALMTVLMLAWCAVSCAAEAGRTYSVEENPVTSLKTYPYRVVSESFELYLSQEDLEALDQDTYFDEMNLFLENLEEDLSEAREFLKDYMKEEVPVIRIFTCFSKPSPSATGIYLGSNQGIMLYGSWGSAAGSILHEYVHYLTLDCFKYGIANGFWMEGIAEYVSELACKNKTARSFNYGLDDLSVANLTARGFADEDGKINIRKYLYGNAASWDMPYNLGRQYLSVSGITMTMTERVQQNPAMDTLTYPQAACFFEYLVDRFGKDQVICHMTFQSIRFRTLYGQSFEDLCCEWKQENMEKCAEMHLNLDAEKQEQ